jgi:hypothetical protein
MKEEKYKYTPAYEVLINKYNSSVALVFGKIKMLSEKKGYCYASKYMLADQLGLSYNTIRDSIHFLEGKIIFRKERKIKVEDKIELPLIKDVTPVTFFSKTQIRWYQPIMENFIKINSEWEASSASKNDLAKFDEPTSTVEDNPSKIEMPPSNIETATSKFEGKEESITINKEEELLNNNVNNNSLPSKIDGAVETDNDIPLARNSKSLEAKRKYKEDYEKRFLYFYNAEKFSDDTIKYFIRSLGSEKQPEEALEYIFNNYKNIEDFDSDAMKIVCDIFEILPF